MCSSQPEVLDRVVVRALLMNEEGSVLLLRSTDPATQMPFWCTPGGAIDAGESVEEALRRELFEELRFSEFSIGAAVWSGSTEFTWRGILHRQHETLYLCQARGDLPIEGPFGEHEEGILEARWWSSAEVFSSGADFRPVELPDIIPSGPCAPRRARRIPAPATTRG